MGPWLGVYKKWIAAAAAALLLAWGLYMYMHEAALRGQGEGWETVNREMAQLLASATPSSSLTPPRETSPQAVTPSPAGSAPVEPPTELPVETPARASAQAPTVQPPLSSAEGKSGERININTATAEALTALPGIGPSKARAIVDYRKEHGKFQNAADLLRVKGIGPKTYESLKERVTVS
jgi:competence protein ComEA